MYKKYFKRPLDFIMALLALIILSPALLVIAILVRIKLGSPVFFIQPRPGLNEMNFTLYKFRTMTNECNENGELLPDEVRLTPFGKFLRSTSLDELPELWNILKGEMSFVGPRPLSTKYIPYYNDNEKRRHEVRPGLTGLAQVNGRNTAIWEKRFAFDVFYIDNITFFNDLKVVTKTIGLVLKRKCIGYPGVDVPQDFDDYRAQ